MSLVRLPKIGGNVQRYNLKNLNDLIETRSEQADIVNAINSGYLVFPGADFIYDRLQKQSDFDEKNEQILEVIEREKLTIEKSLDEDNQLTSAFYFPFVNYLNCSSIPIIEIGDIAMCRNLRILDLSNNHLKHFDALCNLVNLFRLDLQNNQIVDLPDQTFWENMDNLKVLFLHNNPIGKLDYLKNLSACPSIEILTFYDTPMSLRKNYRHHVVNAIVTLKALDDFVVSDEEIIEEAIYDNLFKAHSSAMHIDFSFDNDKSKTYDSSLSETYKLIGMVNTIISHYSPVHILQKYTRGFIARNKFKYMLQAKRIAEFNSQIPNEIEISSQTTLDTGEASSKRIERWWKKSHHQQPKVTPRLTESSKTSHYNPKVFEESRDEFIPKSGDSRKRNIIIDLGKLNKLNYTSLSNKPSQRELSYQNSQNLQSYIDNSDVNINSSVSFSNLVKLIAAYQKETQSQNKNDPTYNYQMEKLISKFNKQFKLEDPQNETTFRLPMLVPDNTILKVKEKYIIDMMKEKHDGTQAVKDMELKCHKKINAIREDIPLIANEKSVTNDQRFFQKAFGNMSFGCLRAIDKAYTDRSKVDARHQRKIKVEKLKEQNKYSMQRVEYYKEDKIKETKFSIKKDNEMKCTYDLRSEKEYDSLKDSVNEQRQKRNQLNKNRRKDVALAVEFSKQHLSVSKALQKHEYLTHKELKSKENNDFILKLKNNKESQRELVRKYMQQRNVLRLIQSNNDRAIIEKRLQEDNEEELRNAKIRVEYLRYLEYNRRARVILKKPKDENPTNVTNLGDTLHTNPEETGAESTVLTEVGLV